MSSGYGLTGGKQLLYCLYDYGNLYHRHKSQWLTILICRHLPMLSLLARGSSLLCRQHKYRGRLWKEEVCASARGLLWMFTSQERGQWQWLGSPRRGRIMDCAGTLADTRHLYSGREYYHYRLRIEKPRQHHLETTYHPLELFGIWGCWIRTKIPRLLWANERYHGEKACT